jgi:hypothetical protein
MSDHMNFDHELEGLGGDWDTFIHVLWGAQKIVK